MIIDWIAFILIYLSVWVLSFLFHELMHCWEAHKQGATNTHINVLISKLSMTTNWSGKIQDYYRIKIAGGLYTSFLMMLLSTLSWFYGGRLFTISFMSIGFVQLVYSFYEMNYLHEIPRKKYDLGRYALYLITVSISLFVLFILL